MVYPQDDLLNQLENIVRMRAESESNKFIVSGPITIDSAKVDMTIFAGAIVYTNDTANKYSQI